MIKSILHFLFGERSPSRPPLFISFIWLVYLAFPLHVVFQRPAGEMIIGLFVIAVFAVIYVYCILHERGRFVLTYALMAVIILFTLQVDPSFMFMGFYLTPLIGMMPTRRKFMITWISLSVFLVSILVVYRNELTSDDLISVIPAMLIMLFMPMAIRFGRRSKELREKLDIANEQIAILSANEERARISRDLHDTLGHSLSLITLKSELTERLILKNSERAIQEVRDIQATSRAALQQVRELVSGLNTATVDTEIHNALQILEAANIEPHLEGRFREGSVTPLINNILGMCLRETVTNVVRHSGASSCTIERTSMHDCLMLIVSDNGQGIDGSVSGKGGCEGNGLKGMRERLKLVEGTITIEPQGEEQGSRGTRVSITIPYVNRSSTGREENNG
ncbi:two-component system sensor histidine kinase DesK [Paenibacillus cellulosilyticus]|uniref:histidine kinase n=1 Tax=Paenibacillus cellulosilyticus TaxID=375489 RepID=A0A2V2YW54_9BACL|nr:sensor histidine kinase [Paenibacillus cellulosilyticus]PWW05596.1 two-component system sensor histidine kinase DesK [Paenibacillus cellulosilyticus]QKS45372.1 sensor histidine kinase [Paenibacillus cellulosilyticus]